MYLCTVYLNLHFPWSKCARACKRLQVIQWAFHTSAMVDCRQGTLIDKPNDRIFLGMR